VRWLSFMKKTITVFSFTMFNSILSTNRNTFAKVGWWAYSRFASCTFCLSSFPKIPYQNWITQTFMTPWITIIDLCICVYVSCKLSLVLCWNSYKFHNFSIRIPWKFHFNSWNNFTMSLNVGNGTHPLVKRPTWYFRFSNFHLDSMELHLGQ
jgi:hypothetical protein